MKRTVFLRDKAIADVERLFPADSTFPDTAKVGQELFLQAMFETWRDAPSDVLTRYAQLCIRRQQEGG
jgi:hypothetical protein